MTTTSSPTIARTKKVSEYGYREVEYKEISFINRIKQLFKKNQSGKANINSIQITPESTAIKELLNSLSNIIDPGAEDQHLLAGIETWFSSQPQTRKKIFQELRKTAKIHHEYNFLLAFFYQQGIGTRVQTKKTFKYYKRAAEKDDYFGQNQLGWCFQNGIGTRWDYDKAFQWYLSSAKGGDFSGMCNLAYCYTDGTGTTVDEKEAFYWFLKSAESGIAVSQNAVAGCFQNGKGTTKDIHKALYWYRRSLKHGYHFWHLGLRKLMTKGY
ncbi:hypothetical protein G9A89_021739 [Geosiphon pyriformis]|nr:hypothetical protein G9A89_021739 [Geosiphon pyriformis]